MRLSCRKAVTVLTSPREYETLNFAPNKLVTIPLYILAMQGYCTSVLGVGTSALGHSISSISTQHSVSTRVLSIFKMAADPCQSDALESVVHPTDMVLLSNVLYLTNLVFYLFSKLFAFIIICGNIVNGILLTSAIKLCG